MGTKTSQPYKWKGKICQEASELFPVSLEEESQPDMEGPSASENLHKENVWRNQDVSGSEARRKRVQPQPLPAEGSKRRVQPVPVNKAEPIAAAMPQGTPLQSEEHGSDTSTSEEESADESASDFFELPMSLDEPLTEEEIEKRIESLVDIELQAAEVEQELEEIPMLALREEVKAELGSEGGMSPEELEAAVDEEMVAFMHNKELEHEELHDRSAALQEILDHAGVNLAPIFKEIDALIAERKTSTWSNTHWAGVANNEADAWKVAAEEELQQTRPVLKKNGQTVGFGASGFLDKRIEDLGMERVEQLYAAETPLQAAELANLDGADEVEEIDDMEKADADIRIAAAREHEQMAANKKLRVRKVVDDELDGLEVKRYRLPGEKRRRKGGRENSVLPTQNSVRTSGTSSQGTSQADVETRMHTTEGLLAGGMEAPSTSIVLHHDSAAGGSGSDSARDEELDDDVLEDKLVVPLEEVSLPSGGHNAERGKAESVGKALEDRVVERRRIVPMRLVSPDEAAGKPSSTNSCRVLSGTEVEPMECVLMMESTDVEERGVSGDSGRVDRLEKAMIVSANGTVHGFRDVRGGEAIGVKDCVVKDEKGGKENGGGKKRKIVVLEIDSDDEVKSVEEDVEEGRGRGKDSQRSSGSGKSAKVKVTGEHRESSEGHTEVVRTEFPCTSCAKATHFTEVFGHPHLRVSLCKQCFTKYNTHDFKKVGQHETECRWCTQPSEQFMRCDGCTKVFCIDCISRNLGQSAVERCRSQGFEGPCYHCIPTPLSEQQEAYMRLEQRKIEAGLVPEDPVPLKQSSGQRLGGRKKGKGLTADDPVTFMQTPQKKGRGRKKIGRIKDDSELEEETKRKIATEQERLERLGRVRQSVLDAVSSQAMSQGSQPYASQGFSQSQHEGALLLLQDSSMPIMHEDRIPINIASLSNSEEDAEDMVLIDPGLAKILKPHQIDGVRHMWDNCIESIEKVSSGAEGVGCVLAHTMGLGKTLQTITFLHTVMTYKRLKLDTALIVLPVNVLHNWKTEFEMWQADTKKKLTVYMVEDTKGKTSRANILSKWQEDGGVLLLGYQTFKNFVLGTYMKDNDKLRHRYVQALVNPGPDILVCDEAHKIKNAKTDITQTLKMVRTGRRIALTGSPLQNNLMEYYCMVDFVRAGFLGSPSDFRNQFENPIKNGQHKDSTAADVRLMKKRVHVLYRKLEGIVQRKDKTVVELPPKTVYVISIRLSKLQRSLYRRYLDVNGYSEGACMEGPVQHSLFKAYQFFQKVWNHPDLLVRAKESQKLSDEAEAARAIALDEDDAVAGPAEAAAAEPEPVEEGKWWREMLEGVGTGQLTQSGKIVLLLELICMADDAQDKTLVFSQSLDTLNIIEDFLPTPGGDRRWTKGLDWYRLDGSLSSKKRQKLVERFNDPENNRVKCVLISTNAGCLGINLQAANRVVIVDGSWNPTNDLQAMFRAWRYGQKKPVFVYRLVASGTMEEKIYNRQIAKEGLAARVVDQHHVGRHLAAIDLEQLFTLDEDPDSTSDPSSFSTLGPQPEQGSGPSGTDAPREDPLQHLPGKRSELFSCPEGLPPTDKLMGNLLVKHRPRWIVRYHEHDPLLENLEDEQLSEEERKEAWATFQQETSAPQFSVPMPGPTGIPAPAFPQPTPSPNAYTPSTAPPLFPHMPTVGPGS